MEVHSKCHKITMSVHTAKLVAHHHLLCLDFHYVHHIQCIHHTIRHIHRQGKFEANKKNVNSKKYRKKVEHFQMRRRRKNIEYIFKHINPIEIGMQLTTNHKGDLKCKLSKELFPSSYMIDIYTQCTPFLMQQMHTKSEGQNKHQANISVNAIVCLCSCMKTCKYLAEC